MNTCLVNMKAEMGVMCLQVKEGKGSPANHVNYKRGPEESLTASEGITPANTLISASASRRDIKWLFVKLLSL